MYHKTIADPPLVDGRPLTVLSLCSGIGGDVAAFTMAGVPHKVLAFAERDPVAAAFLSQKFPLVENVGDIIKFNNWSKFNGKIDILTAGIPCQPFSIAGKQQGTDDQRELTSEIVRIIHEVRPRYVFIENVTRYKTVQNGRAFRELGDGLVAAGYTYGHRIIDAAEVVAQRRRRLFILGHCRDAFYGADEVFADAESLRRRSQTGKQTGIQAAGSPARSSAVHHPPILGTLMASASGLVKAGMRGHELDFLVVQEFEGMGLVVRRPTPKEALRGQGFPDDWLDDITYRGRALNDLLKYKLIGNSWPVPIAASILRSLYCAAHTEGIRAAA
ncbi:DNA cytosine methyltransferase [Shinella zoogloeoides]|uniref:Cytosine-specific methyltransferase n=1 Tax=Shinella zoogloeoides TaxID=352475 RepID=A0A6N8TPH6_SHIZO|nr:DNA (cytosine-5-)-methyltransferase [Shinella zoogloeoides]MXO03054.1 DNA (cytosine-5-)-methyltransferase [Shinella zoogloeoides]UEX81813.1 DNA (cytosine-5-)-methyltransferase [Shinella zoogloeoides]